MNEAEIKAQRDSARIVRVTNPFDFDYTHAWGGQPYTLLVGKPMLLPFPLADHLATHLARQALIRKAPIRNETEIDGKGKDRPLWSDDSIAELKKTIMHEEYTEASAPVLSENEKMAAKIAELNRAFEDLKESVDSKPATVPAATADPVVEESIVAPQNTDSATLDFKDKAEVIAALTKAGIKFDARKKKAELEELLKA